MAVSGIRAESERGIYLITGVMASGKSTVAEQLARRFERGVHVRGDVFRRMIASGRAEMVPDAPEEALSQLLLRHRLAAETADRYYEAGFHVVVQDIVLGSMLLEMIGLIHTRPLYVVVLDPGPEAVRQRELNRPKKGYGEWSPEQLIRSLREETPRLGLWLDTSELTPEETVQAILERARTEASV